MFSVLCLLFVCCLFCLIEIAFKGKKIKLFFLYIENTFDTHGKKVIACFFVVC